MNGRFDPTAGLSSSGIAGTGTDKEDDDAAANKSANADEEMRDISKKEGGKNRSIMNTNFIIVMIIIIISLALAHKMQMQTKLVAICEWTQHAHTHY